MHSTEEKVQKKIGIIGAGPAGLVSAKEALEAGMLPTIFEKNSDIGGVWHPEFGYAWNSLHTNNSRHTCCFSDFPWPFESSLFPTANEMFRYLQKYAKAFDLEKYLRLNCAVQQVKKQGEQWLVKVEGGEEMRFDAILVATGVFLKSHIPEFPAKDHFTGAAIHSALYKQPQDYLGKSVLVVGNSFSGAEIAADLAESASCVINLIRKLNFVFPRHFPVSDDLKLPIDYAFYTRSKRDLWMGFTPKGKRDYFHRMLGGPQQALGLALPSDFQEKDPVYVTITDNYFGKIKEQKIDIERGDLKELSISGQKVIFPSGSEREIDAIIYCTGFRSGLEFLDQALLEEIEYRSDDSLQPLILFQSCLPKSSSNIAFIGLYPGVFFGIMELQARLAIGIFSGRLPPIDQTVLEDGLAEERGTREMCPRPQFPQEDYVGFADRLAEILGVLPDFDQDGAYLKRELAIPAHYRLCGYGAKPEIARQMIKDADRTRREAHNSAMAGVFASANKLEALTGLELPDPV